MIRSRYFLGSVNFEGNNIKVVDDAWLGLGSSAGRIIFEDETTDEVIFKNCKVGIGALTDCSEALHILVDGGGIVLQNPTDENGEAGAETLIRFQDHSDTTLAQIRGDHSGTSDDTKGRLALSTHSGSALAENLIIDESGNVTITGDLRVQGGHIGLTADTDLIAIGAESFTLNCAAATFGITTGAGSITLKSGTSNTATFQTYDGVSYYLNLYSNANISQVFLYNATAGALNLGISNTTKMSISATAITCTADGMALVLKNNIAENGEGGAETLVQFTDHTAAILAQIQGSHAGTSDDTKGDLIFSTHNGTALTERLRLDDSGNVKIGGDSVVISDASGNLTSANGLASFDGAVTNLTVVNGIVTAAS